MSVALGGYIYKEGLPPSLPNIIRNNVVQEVDKEVDEGAAVLMTTYSTEENNYEVIIV